MKNIQNDVIDFFNKVCFTVQAHKRGKVHTESFLKTPLRGCLIAKHFRTPFLGNFLPPTTKKWALLFIREKKAQWQCLFQLGTNVTLFSLFPRQFSHIDFDLWKSKILCKSKKRLQKQWRQICGETFPHGEGTSLTNGMTKSIIAE